MTVQIVSDGTCAYVSFGAIICINESGGIRWMNGGAANGGPTYFTPVRSYNDRLYAGSASGFHALVQGR